MCTRPALSANLCIGIISVLKISIFCAFTCNNEQERGRRRERKRNDYYERGEMSVKEAERTQVGDTVEETRKRKLIEVLRQEQSEEIGNSSYINKYEMIRHRGYQNT